MIAPSDYIVGVPAEDIERYCPGGYHPVHLGDCFKDGRYKVLHKLGYGSYSTVWLARDFQAHRNVSLKVVVAKKSGELAHELRILKHLNEDSSHPGYKLVVHLLDSFYLDGPNGRHLCLIFNVLGPSVASVTECDRLEGCLGRDISTQVLLAVDYLHSSGVVHGDIYTGNILFRVPELDSLSPKNIADKFGQPIIGTVARRDGKPSAEGMPNYLVYPIEFSAKSICGFGEVQLIDFGESFFVDHPPKSITTPISLHPPELVFALELTNAVDIWNLGCTVYELITGRSLFEATFSDHKLIPQFERVIGNMPDAWISNALQDNVLNEIPNGSYVNFMLPLEDDLTRYYFNNTTGLLPLSRDDISTLGKCLRKMLVLDPRNRAQAHELLSDLWFTRRSAKKDPSVYERDFVRNASSFIHGSGCWKNVFTTALRLMARMKSV